MGIRGLYTYIQEYADAALVWHKLQNCKLVIDGNNLAHEIYSNSKGINIAFGGDYDKYAVHIEIFFTKLFECNIEPIVVMDGGYPMQRNKFATVFSRLTSQLETTMGVNPDNQDVMRTFPILGRSVFVGAIQKLGVTVLQADFEADDEIVLLAQELNAYVLSNDSDFYLYDVPFILLHSVNMRHLQKERTRDGTVKKFIPCYRFDVPTFCKITRVRKELLPLLASILGNDFMNPKYLVEFYNYLSSLRPISKSIPHRKKVIISVIKWLAKQDGSADEILTKIRNTRDMKVSSKTEMNMRAVLHMYSPTQGLLKKWILPHEKSCPINNDTSVHKETTVSHADFKSWWLVSNNVGQELRCMCKHRVDNSFVSLGQMPDWFIRAYRMHLIPHTVVDILTKDYLFTVPMIEVLTYNSVYLRLEVLIKKLRGLLWNTLAHGTRKKIREMDTSRRGDSLIKKKLRKAKKVGSKNKSRKYNNKKTKIIENFVKEDSQNNKRKNKFEISTVLPNEELKTEETGFFMKQLIGIKKVSEDNVKDDICVQMEKLAVGDLKCHSQEDSPLIGKDDKIDINDHEKVSEGSDDHVDDKDSESSDVDESESDAESVDYGIEVSENNDEALANNSFGGSNSYCDTASDILTKCSEKDDFKEYENSDNVLDNANEISCSRVSTSNADIERSDKENFTSQHSFKDNYLNSEADTVGALSMNLYKNSSNKSTRKNKSKPIIKYDGFMSDASDNDEIYGSSNVESNNHLVSDSTDSDNDNRSNINEGVQMKANEDNADISSTDINKGVLMNENKFYESCDDDDIADNYDCTDDIVNDICTDDIVNDIDKDGGDNSPKENEEKNTQSLTKILYIPPIRLFVRERETLIAKTLPQENVSTYRKYPSLFKIGKFTEMERKKMFNKTIGLEMNSGELSSKLEFILLSISYWKMMYVSHVEVKAILPVVMCAMMFSIIDDKIGRLRSKGSDEELIHLINKIETKKQAGALPEPSTLTVEELIQSLRIEEYKLASLSLSSFHLMNPQVRKGNYKKYAVHVFNEYQVCVYFLQYLNSLLYFPYPVVTMDAIWSGTFCYNIYECFSSKNDFAENINLVLSTIFNGNDRFSHLFLKLYSIIQTTLSLPSITANLSKLNLHNSIRTKVLNKKKKSAKRKEAAKNKENVDTEMQVDKLENPTEEEFEMLGENKFSALLM